MSGHTPGPWTAALHTALSLDEITPGCDWTIYGSDGVSICFEGAWNVNAKANVQLIMASPDLIEALQTLVKIEDGDGMGITGWETAMSDARAAIAKATGVQP